MEMEEGNLFGAARAGDFFWLPKDKQPSYFAYSRKGVEKKEGIILCQATYDVCLPQITTYICRKCRKGIVEY